MMEYNMVLYLTWFTIKNKRLKIRWYRRWETQGKFMIYILKPKHQLVIGDKIPHKFIIKDLTLDFGSNNQRISSEILYRVLIKYCHMFTSYKINYNNWWSSYHGGCYQARDYISLSDGQIKKFEFIFHSGYGYNTDICYP